MAGPTSRAMAVCFSAGVYVRGDFIGPVLLRGGHPEAVRGFSSLADGQRQTRSGSLLGTMSYSHWNLGILMVVGLVAGGCGPSQQELLEAAQAEEAARLLEAERVELMRLETAVRKSAAAFASCEPERSTPATSWLDLAADIDAMLDAGGVVAPELMAATQGLREAEADVTRIQESIAEGNSPPVLVKPTHHEPEYIGAWYLSGSYRANYTGDDGSIDGVVITKGDNYYVVLGAEPAGGGVRYLNGYVESTGRTIVLDVGRSGREATVVSLADRETYLDDQAAHREAVAEAKHTYDDALAEYRTALRQQAEAKKKLADAMAELDAQLEAATASVAWHLLDASRRVKMDYLVADCPDWANPIQIPSATSRKNAGPKKTATEDPARAEEG